MSQNSSKATVKHNGSLILFALMVFAAGATFVFGGGPELIKSIYDDIFYKIPSPYQSTFDFSKKGVVLEGEFEIMKGCNYNLNLVYISGVYDNGKLANLIGTDFNGKEKSHKINQIRILIEKKVGGRFVTEVDSYVDVFGAATLKVNTTDKNLYGEFRRVLGVNQLSAGLKRVQITTYNETPVMKDVVTSFEIPTQVSECNVNIGQNVLPNIDSYTVIHDIEKRQMERNNISETILPSDKNAALNRKLVRIGMTADEAFLAAGYGYVVTYSSSRPTYKKIDAIQGAGANRILRNSELIFYNNVQFNYEKPILFRAKVYEGVVKSISYVDVKYLQ